MTPEQWIELAKAVGNTFFSWLAAIVIAVIFKGSIARALSGLGKALGSLARRTIKVPGVVSLEAPRSRARQSLASPEKDVVAQPDNEPAPTDPVELEAISMVRARLNQKAADQRLETATRDAGQLLALASRWRIYALIYGSQLVLLKAANAVGPTGVARDIAERIFADTKERNPVFYANTTFDLWIGFLLTPELLRLQDTAYVLTDRGKGFLRWMVDIGVVDTGTWNNAGV